jgi:hypothetical protein
MRKCGILIKGHNLNEYSCGNQKTFQRVALYGAEQSCAKNGKEEAASTA